MTPDRSSRRSAPTHVFTTRLREFGTEGKHWSPCASTLVTGETDAVLTDTGHIKSEITELGDMIEQTGKRLTTIYITHGHLDHFLGIGQLIERFQPHDRFRPPRSSRTSKHQWLSRKCSGRRGSATMSITTP